MRPHILKQIQHCEAEITSLGRLLAEHEEHLNGARARLSELDQSARERSESEGSQLRTAKAKLNDLENALATRSQMYHGQLKMLAAAEIQLNSGSAAHLPAEWVQFDPSLQEVAGHVAQVVDYLESLEPRQRELREMKEALEAPLFGNPVLEQIFERLDDGVQEAVITAMEAALSGDDEALRTLATLAPELHEMVSSIGSEELSRCKQELNAIRRQSAEAENWWREAAPQLAERAKAQYEALSQRRDADLEQLRTEVSATRASIDALAAATQKHDEIDGIQRAGLLHFAADIEEWIGLRTTRREERSSQKARLISREAEYDEALAEFDRDGLDAENFEALIPYGPDGEVTVRYEAAVAHLLSQVSKQAQELGNAARVYHEVLPKAPDGSLWRGHNTPAPHASPKGIALGGALVTPDPEYAVAYVTNQGTGHPFLPPDVGFLSKYSLKPPAKNSPKVLGAKEWIENEAQEHVLGDTPDDWPLEILATEENAELERIYLATDGRVARESSPDGTKLINITEAARTGFELKAIQSSMDRDLIARSLAKQKGRVVCGEDWIEAARVLSGAENLDLNALSRSLWADRNLSIAPQQQVAFAGRFLRKIREAHQAEAKTITEYNDALAAAPAPAQAQADGIPSEFAVLSRWDGPQEGSNPGGWYRTHDSERYYVKQYSDAAQAWNEHVANRIYQELGVATADTRLLRGDSGILLASREVEDSTPSYAQSWTRESARAFLKGHVADALLLNWDVTGKGYTNLRFDRSGVPVRLDQGGSLLYRAKNGRKDAGEMMLPDSGLAELTSLVDPRTNSEYAAVIAAADYTPEEWEAEVARQAREVRARLPAVRLRDIVQETVPIEVQPHDVDSVINVLTSRCQALAGVSQMEEPPQAPEAHRPRTSLRERAVGIIDREMARMQEELLSEPEQAPTTRASARLQ